MPSGAVRQQGKNIAQKAEMMARFYKLRSQGLSVRQIADIEGCCIATVSRYCKEAALLVIAPEVEEFRQTQDEQLDMLWNKLQARIEKGDTFAIDAALKILDRRAKLWGLDKPIKHDVTLVETTETDRKLAELAEQLYTRREVTPGVAASEHADT